MKFASWPHHADFIQTPLPVLTMVLLVLGVQFFFMGLLAEMLVRTYHESQAKADLCGEGKNWFHHRGHSEEPVTMRSCDCEPGHSWPAEVCTVGVSGWDKESVRDYFELRVDPSADANGTDLVLYG